MEWYYWALIYIGGFFVMGFVASRFSKEGEFVCAASLMWPIVLGMGIIISLFVVLPQWLFKVGEFKR